MAGKIIADQIEHSTAGSLDTSYVVNGSAKAWAKVNQVGSQSILDSFNVASITDNGVSTTIVTFVNSMSNENYSISGSTDFGIDDYSQHQFSSETTSSFTAINSPDYSSGFEDNVVSSTVHGDLA